MDDNKIQYIELYAPDLAKIKQFYSNAFGWEFTDYGGSYTAFSHKSSGVDGGFEKVDAVRSGGPLVVLYHSNLEAARENVRAHGAEISKDIFVFPGGRRFHFIDPAGNELAVWSQR